MSNGYPSIYRYEGARKDPNDMLLGRSHRDAAKAPVFRKY